MKSVSLAYTRMIESPLEAAILRDAHLREQQLTIARWGAADQSCDGGSGREPRSCTRTCEPARLEQSHAAQEQAPELSVCSFDVAPSGPVPA